MAKNNSRSAARTRRHLRVRKKVRGTAECPRLNVFRSLSEIYAQIIDDDTGNTLLASSTIDQELRPSMMGLSKTDAKDKGIQKVVFDRGGYQYFGRVKALAEAAREGGLKF